MSARVSRSSIRRGLSGYDGVDQRDHVERIVASSLVSRSNSTSLPARSRPDLLRIDCRRRSRTSGAKTFCLPLRHWRRRRSIRRHEYFALLQRGAGSFARERSESQAFGEEQNGSSTMLFRVCDANRESFAWHELVELELDAAFLRASAAAFAFDAQPMSATTSGRSAARSTDVGVGVLAEGGHGCGRQIPDRSGGKFSGLEISPLVSDRAGAAARAACPCGGARTRARSAG